LFIIKSIKRELKTRPIYDCRCDERLEPKYDEFTSLGYTGLLEELEYLKIETRLIDEKFASVMGECDVSTAAGTPFKEFFFCAVFVVLEQGRS
jgi:hypothetical protein